LAAVAGIAAAASIAAFAVGHELESFADDFEFAAFFAGFLVIPGVHLETSFDVGAASLAQILLGEFGLAAPQGDIDKGGFLLFLALVVIPNAVDGERDIRHGGSLGSVSQFRIPGQVSDQHDFV